MSQVMTSPSESVPVGRGPERYPKKRTAVNAVRTIANAKCRRQFRSRTYVRKEAIRGCHPIMSTDCDGI